MSPEVKVRPVMFSRDPLLVSLDTFPVSKPPSERFILALPLPLFTNTRVVSELSFRDKVVDPLAVRDKVLAPRTTVPLAEFRVRLPLPPLETVSPFTPVTFGPIPVIDPLFRLMPPEANVKP